jgi:hypothetical protein
LVPVKIINNHKNTTKTSVPTNEKPLIRSFYGLWIKGERQTISLSFVAWKPPKLMCNL